jgi:hypothetical protein
MSVLDNFNCANESPLSDGGQWGGDWFGRASLWERKLVGCR